MNLGVGILIVFKTKKMDEITKRVNVVSSKDWVLEFCNVKRLEMRETIKECRIRGYRSKYRWMWWW